MRYGVLALSRSLDRHVPPKAQAQAWQIYDDQSLILQQRCCTSTPLRVPLPQTPLNLLENFLSISILDTVELFQIRVTGKPITERYRYRYILVHITKEALDDRRTCRYPRPFDEALVPLPRASLMDFRNVQVGLRRGCGWLFRYVDSFGSCFVV